MYRYLLNLSVILSLLHEVVKTDSGDSIPTSGNFFYAEIYFNDNNNAVDKSEFYLNQGLGCNNFQQKWMVSTSLAETMTFFTTDCADNMCTVPSKFNMKDDKCSTNFELLNVGSAISTSNLKGL